MINIIISCTPNYSNRRVINTTNKKIDMVSQFLILYRSIKDNWKFDYRINLFYNKNILFDEKDLKALSSLDIDMFGISPDDIKTPYMLRCNALTCNLNRSGSHRLLIDCDTIALGNPNFDLSCDWQAMYANSVIREKYYDYINKKFKYNLNLKDKIKGKLFCKYMSGENSEGFFPHFNGGAFLIRESLCGAFKELTVPSYGIAYDDSVPDHIRHIGVQYGASFALMNISKNWKPFDAGFNYLVKEFDVNKFGKDNITLLHYCGIGGFEVAYANFRRTIDSYTD